MKKALVLLSLAVACSMGTAFAQNNGFLQGPINLGTEFRIRARPRCFPRMRRNRSARAKQLVPQHFYFLA